MKSKKVFKPNGLQLELSSIATAKFYEFQELRKSCMNRIRNVVFRKATGLDLRDVQKKKRKSDEEKSFLKEFEDKNLPKKISELRRKKKISKSEEEYLNKMFELLDDVKKKEAQYKELVADFVEKEPVFTGFAKYVKGMGVLMTAMLLYYFGYCEKAKYPSSLTKYAGIYPEAKFVKGERAGFNPKCRMFVWRLGDSFIKQRSPRYRSVYDSEKARQLSLLENNHELAPKSLGHADARARRKMMKRFLSDYYRVCKTLTGQEQSKPYVIDKMGHSGFDDVLEWLEKQKLKELKKLG